MYDPRKCPSAPPWMQLLPSEVLHDLGLLVGAPAPVARLACASRECRERLTDPASGRLRLASVVAKNLHVGRAALHCSSWRHLREVRMDLFDESSSLAREDVEDLVASLGRCLQGSGTPELRSLALRLASFDSSMERLRLGRRSRQALAVGLHALARHGRLASLELSFMPIKMSQALEPLGFLEEPAEEVATAGSRSTTGPRACSAEPLTLFGALGHLASLEELSLVSDDIFGTTALELAKVLRRLPRLQRLDLTRNRISKAVMRDVLATVSPSLKVVGGDSQAFFSC